MFGRIWPDAAAIPPEIPSIVPNRFALPGVPNRTSSALTKTLPVAVPRGNPRMSEVPVALRPPVESKRIFPAVAICSVAGRPPMPTTELTPTCTKLAAAIVAPSAPFEGSNDAWIGPGGRTMPAVTMLAPSPNTT